MPPRAPIGSWTPPNRPRIRLRARREAPMRILMVNVPHPAIGSRASHEHLPPLSLLAVAGPLIDAGHKVKLIDGELDALPLDEIARCCMDAAPEAVLLGHSGSTSAHPIVAHLTRRLREAMPRVWIVYGGI